MATFSRDVVVVGGCGHVGLGLALALADRGLAVAVYDVDEEAVALVNKGVMPFDEAGAQEVMDRVVPSGALVATADPASVSTGEHVVVVIGTPVDEHLNPDPQAIPKALDASRDYFVDGQIVILRSTVYPGVTAMVERQLASYGCEIDVAFCPERIAEGRAMEELTTLPQIVGARSQRAADRSERFFRHLTDEIVHVEPEEAELAKLFTNTWRYIKFATANQLFMVANDFGLDFERVRRAITYKYPRAADMPGAGLAAGPCLLKDTMQIAAFNNNNFPLGHAAMFVNEGLPLYIVARLEAQHELAEMTVGILGMAFKAESDDIRSSLSYKLKRILAFKAARTLCTDPYVRNDPDLYPLDEVVDKSDLLIIAAPHRLYASIETSKPIVDIWDLMGRGVRV